MTVGEIRKALERHPDDLELVINVAVASKDARGISYRHYRPWSDVAYGAVYLYVLGYAPPAGAGEQEETR